MFTLKICLTLMAAIFVYAKEGDKPEESKDLPEWVQVQTRVEGLRAKVQIAQDNINKLLDEKQKLPDGSSRLKGLVGELNVQHKEFRRLVEEYEKQNGILKYRFPERAASRSKKTEKIEVKSLEQMEQEQSVESRLDRNIETLRRQYGSRAEKKEKPQTIKDMNQAPLEEADVPTLRK